MKIWIKVIGVAHFLDLAASGLIQNSNFSVQIILRILNIGFKCKTIIIIFIYHYGA